jgi:hydrogenase-4 membrane subunit HyfE
MATISHPHENQVKVASGLDVLAAIWLFISAFTVPMTYSLAWTNGVIAVIVFVLAGIRASGAYDQSWLSWVNAILGLCALLAPWFASVNPRSPAIINNVITGGIIILLAIWSALATNTEGRNYRSDTM